MSYPGERRERTRFEIRGMARFSWKTEEGRWQEGSGTTANISCGGAFIESETTPNVGSQVRIVVALQVEARPELDIHLYGVGNVRHSRDRPTERVGFGAWAVFRREAPPWEEHGRIHTDAVGYNDVANDGEAKAPQSHSNARSAVGRLNDTAVQTEGRKVT